MAKSSSGILLAFGVVNILICLLAPCASCIGMTFYTSQPTPVVIDNRDLGPQFRQHIDRDVPHAKAEAISALVFNSLVSVLLITGSVGLFFAQNWARWLTIAAALLFILGLCMHDVYQLAVFRPAVMNFLDQNAPRNMQNAEREGFKFGFSASFFAWSCTNPVCILYLGVMIGCLAMSSEFEQDKENRPRRRRKPDYDDEDDDDDY